MQERWWSLVGWRRGWGRVKPLGEAPSVRPQKRPTDVHSNLFFALNSRKMSMWLWGRRRGYGFDGCQFWGFSSFGLAPYRLGQCGDQGICQGQNMPRMESPIFPAEQKKLLDTESAVLSTGAQQYLRTRCCSFDHLPGAQPAGGRHLDQTPRNFTRVFLTSILKSTSLSFSESNSCVRIQCSSVLNNLFICISHARQILLKTSCRLTSCRWLFVLCGFCPCSEWVQLREAAFHPQAHLPWGRCRWAMAWEKREVVGARMHFGFPKSMEESYHINSLLSLYFCGSMLVVGNAVSQCVIWIGVPLETFP